MTPEGARLLLQMLARIDLKGGEVALFSRLVHEIEMDANAAVKPMNGEDHARTFTEAGRD